MSDAREFSGQVAVVSGAARGIGRAVAVALLERGADVAGVDTEASPLEELHEVARRSGVRFLACRCDVSHADQVQSAVATTLSALGAPTLLASVAGVLRPGTALSTTLQDWEHQLAVNATGVFLLCRAVAPYMVANRRGAIVCVASNAGRVPRLNLAAYAASKACTLSFVKSLGLELAQHGIRCNTVSPGSTDTSMQRQLWTDPGAPARVVSGSLEEFRLGIPLGRIASPEMIAETVLFLLSERRAGHITLEDVCVDGGATLGV